MPALSRPRAGDPGNPVSALLDGSGRPPGRPLVTTLGPDGEREPLSARTLGLWAAKTANLVTDDLGLGAGDVVAVRLPWHWQVWAWLLGARWAGVDVDLAGPGEPLPDDASALVTSAPLARPVPGVEVLALSLLPLAAPGPVPLGVLDYDTEIRAHGDRFVPTGPAGSLRLRPGAGALLDSAGTPTAARSDDVVLTTATPATAADAEAVWSALAAGAALVIAGPQPSAAVVAAAAAEGCSLVPAGDGADPAVWLTPRR